MNEIQKLVVSLHPWIYSLTLTHCFVQSAFKEGARIE